MRVTFIAHSGFLVELEEQLLLFDYSYKELPPLPDKPLTVFVSHSHEDHCNPAIFRLRTSHTRPVRYLLSRDIRLTAKRCAQWNLSEEDLAVCTTVRPDSSYELEGLSVETVKSTDLGVAFCVTAEGVSLYHAGDLNWWHWSGESDRFNENMARSYEAAMQKLAGKHFDLAFVPVDGRLGDFAALGADALLRHAGVKRLFPMHFWEDFSQSTRYARHCPDPCVEVLTMERFLQSWTF